MLSIRPYNALYPDKIGREGGRRMKRRTRTYVSGIINGVRLSGEGKGEILEDRGLSKGSITFSSFPSNFSPEMCRSWKCKHHVCVPPAENPSLRVFPKRDFIIEETMLYYGGANGRITTKGIVREHEWGTEAISWFEGTYAGPIRAESYADFRDTFVYMGDGLYHISGYRLINGVVENIWYGTLRLDHPVDPEEGLMDFRQVYSPSQWRWDGRVYEVVLNVSKVLNLNLSVQEGGREACEIYRELEGRRLSRLGLNFEDVPHFSKDKFGSLPSLVALYNGEPAGLIVYSLEEIDDLLPGKYVDILVLGVREGFYGLGVEGYLFREVKKRYPDLPIRGTVYWDDEETHLLMQTLGLKERLIRMGTK
jgi:hypothetical protein